MLNNWTTAQQSFESAVNSTNSAMEENERVINSIQGRLTILSNDWQKMWNNSVNTETIKFFIDLADAIVRVTTEIGILPTILGAVAFAFAAIKTETVVKGFNSIVDAVRGFSKIIDGISSKGGAKNFGEAFSFSFNTKDITEYRKQIGNLIDLSSQWEKAIASRNAKEIASVKTRIDSAVQTDNYTRSQLQALAATRSDNAAQGINQQAHAMAAASKIAHTAAAVGLRLAIAALSAVVVIGITKLIQYSQEQKRIREEANKAAYEISKNETEAYLKAGNAAREYYAVVNKSNSTEQQQQQALDKVVKALGDKAEALEHLEEGTEEYKAALERLIATEYTYSNMTQSPLTSARDAQQTAANNLTNVKDNRLKYSTIEPIADTMGGGSSEYIKQRERELEAFKIVAKETADVVRDSWTGLKLDIDTSSASETAQAFYTLSDARAELSAQGLSDTEQWTNLNTAIETSRQAVEEYTQSLVNRYVIEQGTLPSTSEQYRQLVNNIVESENATGSYEERIRSLVADLFPELAYQTEVAQTAFEKLNEKVKGTGSELEDVELPELQAEFDTDELNRLIDMFNDAEYDCDDLGDSLQDLRNRLDDYEASCKRAEIETEGLSKVIKDSAEEIDDFQDTLGKMSSILEDAFDGSMDADDFLDAIQEIADEIEDFSGDTKDMLNDMFEDISFGDIDELANISETIARLKMEEVFNRMADAGVNSSAAAVQAATNMAIAQARMNSAANGLSSLSSAYNTLTSAVEQYNSTGYMTFDTLNNLLTLEPQYLACLQEENGQLVINQQAMIALAMARLDEAEAAAYEMASVQMAELATRNDSSAKYENVSASNAMAASEATVQSAAYNSANAFGVAAAAARDYAAAKAGALGAGYGNSSEFKAIDSSLQAQLKGINSARNALRKGNVGGVVGGKTASKGGGGGGGGKGGGGGAGKDAEKAAKQAEDAAKKAAEEAAKAAEEARKKIVDQFNKILQAMKKGIEEGGITWKEYLDELKNGSQRLYDEGTIDYMEYVEYQHQYLEEQVNFYKAVAKAVETALEHDRIKPLEKEIKLLEKEKKILEKNADAIEDYYDALRKPLEKTLKVQEDILQGIEDEIKARERLIEQVEKKYAPQLEALEEKITNYEDEVYALEQEIKAYEKLQKPINKHIQALEEQIALLEKQKHYYEDQEMENDRLIRKLELQQEPYQDQIKLLEKELDKLKDANDERERAINLQQALYDLQRAENQRNILTYTGGQFEYQADPAAMRDARKELDGLFAEQEMKSIEDRIKKLQEPIDAIQEQIDEITRKNERLGDIIDEIDYKIHGLEDAITPLEDSLTIYERKIDLVNEKVEAWEEKIEALERKSELLERAQEAEIKPIQKTIEKLEEEKQKVDDIIEGIERQIDKWDDAEDAAKEPIEAHIAVIDREIDKLEEDIDKIQEYIDKWQEAIDEWEYILATQTLVEYFGDAWQDALYSLDPQIVETFKDAYLDACRALADHSRVVVDAIREIPIEIEAAAEAAADLADAVGGGGGSNGGGGNRIGGSGSETATTPPKKLSDLGRLYSDTGGTGSVTSDRLYRKRYNSLVDSLESGKISMQEFASKVSQLDSQIQNTNKTAASFEKNMHPMSKVADVTNSNIKAIDTQAPKTQRSVQTAMNNMGNSSKSMAKTVSDSTNQSSKAVTGLVTDINWAGSEIIGSMAQTGQDFAFASKAMETTAEATKSAVEAVGAETVAGVEKNKGLVADVSKKTIDTVEEGKKSITDKAKQILDRMKKSKTDTETQSKEIKRTAEQTRKGVETEATTMSDKIAATKVALTASMETLTTSVTKATTSINTAIENLLKTSQTSKRKIQEHWSSEMEGTRRNIEDLKNKMEEVKQASDDAASSIRQAHSDAQSTIGTMNQLQTAAGNARDALNSIPKSIHIAITADTSVFNDIINKARETQTAVQNAINAANSLPSAPAKGSNPAQRGRGYNPVTGDIMAKGGRVYASPIINTSTKRVSLQGAIKDLAESMGEDTMIAVKAGEGVFTEKQTDDLEDFIVLTPALIQATESLGKYAKLMAANFNPTGQDSITGKNTQENISRHVRGIDQTAQNTSQMLGQQITSMQFTIGDIHIANANDVNDLALQIRNNLPNAMIQQMMMA